MITSFTAVDIETTGLAPLSDQIIEVGAVRYTDGKENGCFSALINPGVPLPELITELTGITDAMLQEASGPDIVLPEFYSFLGRDILLGHNLIFDYSFLKKAFHDRRMEFERQGIDTLKLSRRLHPEFPKRSLAAMCRAYRIINSHAHRAAGDARAAGELYFKLADIFYNDKEALFLPEALSFHIKKESPATRKQKNYLLDLMKWHKIDTRSVLGEKASIDSLTKSEASRLIDRIIFQYGRILS